MTKKAAHEKECISEKPATGEKTGSEQIPGSTVRQAELEQKIATLEAEIVKERQQVEKYRESLLRQAAEFENFRKQKERESMLAGSRSLENVIREMLPMLDDLKRVMQHTPAALQAAAEAKPFVDGVELLRKNFSIWLENKGVKEIDSKGKKLDVNYHEAISQIDHPESEPDTIIEEYQTGYLLGDKVIRHAKVIVAR